MTDLDERLRSLRAAVGAATVADFDDVLVRHRRTRRRHRTVAYAAALAAVATAVFAAVGGLTGRQAVRETPVSPGPTGTPVTASPQPRPSASAGAAAVAALFGASAVAVGPDGTVWALVGTDCVGDGPATCRPVVERSTDAGTTWTLAGSLPPYSDIRADLLMLATGPADLWARTDGQSGLSVSHDGGRTWRAVATPRVADAVTAAGAVWALTCPTSSTCQVRTGRAGGDALSPTAGQPFDAYPQSMRGPGELAAVDAKHALVVQPGAPAYAVTADGGRTWTARRAPCSVQAGSVRGTPDGAYWLLCAGQPSAGTQPKQLYRSTDHAVTWQREPDPGASGYATRLTAVDATTAWRTGGRSPVYRTSDGGTSWQGQLTDVFGDQSTGVSLEAFAAHGRTAVAIRAGTTYTSTDAGRTWRRSDLAQPATPATARAVANEYLQRLTVHDAAGVGALFAPEYAGTHSAAALDSFLHALRSVTGIQVHAPQPPQGDLAQRHRGYTDVLEVPVSYTATFDPAQDLYPNGPYFRFLLLGRDTAAQWRILDITTGP